MQKKRKSLRGRKEKDTNVSCERVSHGMQSGNTITQNVPDKGMGVHQCVY
jgi:hypothetical protein